MYVDIFGRMNITPLLPESSPVMDRESSGTLAPQWTLPLAPRGLDGVALNSSFSASSAADQRDDRSTFEALLSYAYEKRLFGVAPLWLLLCVALVLFVGLVVAHIFFILRCCRDRRRKTASRLRKGLENGGARGPKKQDVNYIAMNGTGLGGSALPNRDPFQRDIDLASTLRDGSPVTCVPFSSSAGAERSLMSNANTLDGRTRRKTRRSTKSLSGDALSNPNLPALLDSPADFAVFTIFSIFQYKNKFYGFYLFIYFNSWKSSFLRSIPF